MNAQPDSLDEVLHGLHRLDWVARAKAIDNIKRQLGVIERRTLCDMPGHLRWLTPQHADLRRRRFARDGHRCTKCGRPGRLRLHHRSYAHIGTPDELQDTRTLCESCHAYTHRHTRSGHYHREGQLRIAA